MKGYAGSRYGNQWGFEDTGFLQNLLPLLKQQLFEARRLFFFFIYFIIFLHQDEHGQGTWPSFNAKEKYRQLEGEWKGNNIFKNKVTQPVWLSG